MLVSGEVDDANVTYPHGYDIEIPDSLRKAYSSGTSENSTIANYFDIEYRRYQNRIDTVFPYINNGSEYLVGAGS